MTESARAEAFASQADRSRAQTEGYVRQGMDIVRRIRDLSALISQQLSRHSIPHRWVGTELQLLSPETGEWLAGPNLRGPQGLGISGMTAGEDGRLVVSLESGATFDAGPLPVGPAGSSAFVYVAYASDDEGADFSAEFNAELKYIAVLTTDAAIAEPSAEDFAGLWVRYRGRDGTDGDDGADGGNGWTPKLAIVSDGDRRVFQVNDWLGGTSVKPEIGQYLGASGWVETAGEALDVRGPAGAAGSGAGDMTAAVYDPNGKAADAFDVDNHIDGSTNKVLTASEKTKLGHITVTQAVDLDAIEARMVALDAAVILKGS